MINPGLAGKVALVTGANHGIGAATVTALAAQGVKVFIAYYREPARYTEEEMEEARRAGVPGVRLYWATHRQTADPVVEQIRASGGEAAAHEADLAQAEQVVGSFSTCEEAFGPVEILVNNHTHSVLDTFDPAAVTSEGFGISAPAPEHIDAHFAINARGYALMMWEFARRHIDRKATWGRIINVSTDAAHAHAGAISYAASKHAIESYSRSAAAELGKYGITVNIVAPGPVQTNWMTPAQEAAIGPGTPLGRCGRPDDIADVIVFLASQQARWLTGQLLYVGGGWRMHQ